MGRRQLGCSVLHPKFHSVCTTELGYDQAQIGFGSATLKYSRYRSIRGLAQGWINDISGTEHTVASPSWPMRTQGIDVVWLDPPMPATASVRSGFRDRPEEESAPDHHLPGQHRPQLTIHA
jgi:hypothetical protein